MNWALLRRRYAFLLFALPPVAVLLTQNLIFDAFVAGLAQDLAKLPDRYTLLPFPKEVRTALSHGRFEWMTRLLASLVLYAGIAVLAMRVMDRQLRTGVFFGASAVWMIAGLAWAGVSIIARPLQPSVEFLFVNTRALALSRYDSDFAAEAMRATEMVYAFALLLTALMVVAAASVLSRPDEARLDTAEELTAKRHDLKVAVATASLLLTLIATTLGSWLAWPVNFVLAQDKLEPPTPFGSAEELKSMADGLQIYFGTGYSLTLLAFTVPAVIALSRRVKETEKAAADAAKGAGSAEEPVLGQQIFSKSEIAALLTVAGPIVTVLIGSTDFPFPL